MERQSITSLVAMDLSAAFNTVDHDTLLLILNHKFGIEDRALKWFDQYLRPRSFKVTINSQYIRVKELAVSVPQGSCVGANIFNLYCLHPCKKWYLEGLKPSGFANDYSVRREFKANDRSEELSTLNRLERCILRVKRWMDETHLKMNTTKTEFIYFGNQHQLNKCIVNTINVAGDLVVRTDTIKYLDAYGWTVILILSST